MHGQLHAQALNMLNSTAKVGILDKVTAVNSDVFAQTVNSQLWISQIGNLNKGMKHWRHPCSVQPAKANHWRHPRSLA
jgi:hypothetical protein